MTGMLPLIIREERVSRGLLSRMRESQPGIAVVYSDQYGQVACFDGRPLSRSQQLATRYRTRYEVDLSDHRRTAQLLTTPLPAMGDAYFFETTVDVGFRVTDPAEVVRRKVADALVVVYNHLIDVFRPVTRRHDIQDAMGAEAELNALFSQPVRLDEGITIYRCSARLLPDAAAQQYIRSGEIARRTQVTSAAEHAHAMHRAQGEGELDLVRQRYRHEAEGREVAAVGDGPLDLERLMRLHLAKHPDDTAYATELLWRYQQAVAAQRDTDDKRITDMTRYMMEQGLIQSVDVEGMRTRMLGRFEDFAGPGRPAELPGASSWDEPLPGAQPPVLHVESVTVAPAPAPAAGLAEPGRTIPVYVIVDESAEDDSYFEALNVGMQRLPSELAGHAEISRAVRIAVIGYARDVNLRMPLRAVGAESYVPGSSHRDGGNLARVFEYLRERIAQDVGNLKAQGLTPGRPTVYLLCATAAEADSAWQPEHRLLTDRDAFPYAPNIIVCGLGSADPEAIGRIASMPESGWVAAPGTPVGAATESCMAFVRQSIVILGQAHVSGTGGITMTQPDGFMLAAGEQ